MWRIVNVMDVERENDCGNNDNKDNVLLDNAKVTFYQAC